MTNPTRKPDEPFFCSRPWTGFEIENDGTVTPCCMSLEGCGNVRDQSIMEIWNGERYQEFRRKMAAGQWQDVCRPQCPRLHGEIEDAKPWPLAEAFAQNYRTNQEEIERRAIVLESRPRIWKLTHSTLCNLDCVMCYQERDDFNTLPESFYQEIAELYDSIQEIQIIGGEPFAIRRARDFIASFPQAAFPDTRFSFVTNGTIHDEKTIALVKSLRVSWMSISVDAATAPTYAHIRRNGNLPLTIEGIKKWVALGKEMGFPVLLAFTVMKDNVNEMDLFVEMARGLGADCLFGWIQGTKGNQHLLDQDALRSSIERTKAVIESAESGMPLAAITLASIGLKLSDRTGGEDNL